jgi:hypothetical protein
MQESWHLMTKLVYDFLHRRLFDYHHKDWQYEIHRQPIQEFDHLRQALASKLEFGHRLRLLQVLFLLATIRRI